MSSFAIYTLIKTIIIDGEKKRCVFSITIWAFYRLKEIFGVSPIWNPTNFGNHATLTTFLTDIDSKFATGLLLSKRLPSMFHNNISLLLHNLHPPCFIIISPFYHNIVFMFHSSSKCLLLIKQSSLSSQNIKGTSWSAAHSVVSQSVLPCWVKRKASDLFHIINTIDTKVVIHAVWSSSH